MMFWSRIIYEYVEMKRGMKNNIIIVISVIANVTLLINALLY